MARQFVFMMRTPLVAALLLQSNTAHARVTGVWTDIESHEQIVGEYLRNATAIAHTANLRMVVDAQVGWAIEQNTQDPGRPVHEQVMDIVDEVCLMDYFTGCAGTLSTPGEPCDPTMAMFWLGPWLSYANFLLAAKNRTVLIDVGVGVNPTRNASTGSPNYPANHWISSEVDLELFLQRSWAFIRSLQGEGPTSGDPGMLPPFLKSWCTGNTKNYTQCRNARGPFHNFAVFQQSSYKAIAVENGSCHASHPACGPAASRPPRAIWWYGILKNPVLNESIADEIINFCAARHVTELYLDEWNSTSGSTFEAFVRRADHAGIDLLIYVGEDAGPARAQDVAGVVGWCNTSSLCGPRDKVN